MKDDEAVQGARKPYHPPVIEDLGSLRDLTAGGGGNLQDGTTSYDAAALPGPSS